MSAATATSSHAFPARAPRREHHDAPLHAIEVASSRDQRRARPRLLAAIVTVGGLFAILTAQLLLAIATSDGAYQISTLQAQQNELARDEQVLLEQLQVLGAPQHLAAEAQAMGMVRGSSAAYLRLADGAVLGAPVAATADAALRTAPDGTSLIPNALLEEVALVAAAASAEADSESTGAPGTTSADGSVASAAPVGIPSPNTR